MKAQDHSNKIKEVMESLGYDILREYTDNCLGSKCLEIGKKDHFNCVNVSIFNEVLTGAGYANSERYFSNNKAILSISSSLMSSKYKQFPYLLCENIFGLIKAYMEDQIK